MPRVVHFEVGADDPERAGRFYSEIFGWKIQKWDGPEPYYLIETGPADQLGINGGMFVRKGPIGHINTIDVADIDETLEQIVAKGGEIAMPKREIPGIGWLAYGKDTEGSVFGVMQMDPPAP